MPGPFSVTIPAAEMGRVSLSIEIINDGILEHDESFNLTINPSSLPSNVVAGGLGQVEITIEDDSGKLIYNFVTVVVVVVVVVVVIVTVVLPFFIFIVIFVIVFKPGVRWPQAGARLVS